MKQIGGFVTGSLGFGSVVREFHQRCDKSRGLLQYSLRQMPKTSDRKVRQVLPVGRSLPTVVNCVPNKMTEMPDSGFQKTRWSLVRAAAIDSTGASRRALGTLCHDYWRPVYAFIRRNGHDPDQAQDLTQGFFAL